MRIHVKILNISTFKNMTVKAKNELWNFCFLLLFKWVLFFDAKQCKISFNGLLGLCLSRTDNPDLQSYVLPNFPPSFLVKVKKFFFWGFSRTRRARPLYSIFNTKKRYKKFKYSFMFEEKSLTFTTWRQKNYLPQSLWKFEILFYDTQRYRSPLTHEITI